jgi:CubicO group peptidase (beta-lactamase class C family)
MIEDLAMRAFAAVRPFLGEEGIPCAALGLVTAGGERAAVLAGDAALAPEREALTRAHWFDLASLTKVIATTPMILALAEQGRLDLDDFLTTAIPDIRQYDEIGAAERRLTFRDCLAHRTHLPAVFPLYTYGEDPERLKALVLQREWVQGPPVYSDINFIYLGIAIERLIGSGLRGLAMPPGLGYDPPGPCVATEHCRWRGRVMKGEVHDENAFALSGAAGHAGLFGTVDGVLDFARGLLDGSGASAFALEAIRAPHGEERTLGWERRHRGWQGGEACSASTIGHTGFTGTGLWIDFDRGIAWTLLTNRIHPTRHVDNGIFELRPALGDAVIAAFDALSEPPPAPATRGP